MFNSVKKIISVILFAALGWNSLDAVFGTYAMFAGRADTKTAVFQTGTLNFSAAGTDFAPEIDLANVKVSNCALVLANTGTIDIKYRVIVQIPADNALCDNLLIKDNFGVADFIPLVDYISATSTLAAAAAGSLAFETELASDDLALEGMACDFNLVFNAWQSDFENASQGFTGQKIVLNTVRTVPKTTATCEVGKIGTAGASDAAGSGLAIAPTSIEDIDREANIINGSPELDASKEETQSTATQTIETREPEPVPAPELTVPVSDEGTAPIPTSDSNNEPAPAPVATPADSGGS